MIPNQSIEEEEDDEVLESGERAKPMWPMRINKFLAMQRQATRRPMDELIRQKRVFINGRLAVLGDKVKENDTVEVRFHKMGKEAPKGKAPKVIEEKGPRRGKGKNRSYGKRSPHKGRR